MAENSKQKKDKRPIVCGTDFSATATEAVDIAAEMARHLDVTLLLLHVQEFRGLAVADPSIRKQGNSECGKSVFQRENRLKRNRKWRGAICEVHPQKRHVKREDHD
jgi:hypothetical protein